MPRHEDLSVVGYHVDDRALVAVGFLSADHPFTRGPVPPRLVDALLRAVRSPREQHRGHHHCPLCEVRSPVRMVVDGVEVGLGSSELGFRAGDRTFVAPSLVVHYITDHDYRPPAAFIRAVLSHG